MHCKFTCEELFQVIEIFFQPQIINFKTIRLVVAENSVRYNSGTAMKLITMILTL